MFASVELGLISFGKSPPTRQRTVIAFTYSTFLARRRACLPLRVPAMRRAKARAVADSGTTGIATIP
jgi:hypothetical protein